jgi:glycerol-3-phosphate acyltransferase PlsY
MTLQIALLILAYLIGSIPTALWVARHLAGVDIRRVGDGNMGALNTGRTLGWRAGTAVALIDFTKGAFPVALASVLGFPLGWQMATGTCAILGHDFPLFARFAGGQGTSTTIGVMFILLPLETLAGFALWGVLLWVTHNFNLSAGVGMGFTLAVAIVRGCAWFLLAYYVTMFLLVLFKRMLDTPRRALIHQGSRAR